MTQSEVLTMGQSISLGREFRQLRTSVSWRTASDDISVDLIAFILGQNSRVRSNSDMIFYNQPHTADASVVCDGKVSLGGYGTEELAVNLDLLGNDVLGLMISVSSEGSPLGEVTELEWCVLTEAGEAAVSYRVEGLTTEHAAVLGELYRQDNLWRLRAVGQGCKGGLAEMAIGYGVTLAPEEPIRSPITPRKRGS